MTGVDDFVGAIEASMRAAIESSPTAAPAARLLDAGGKRLRARLVWWAAAACREPLPAGAGEPLIRAGSAIELAHLASLIHDDLVDGAETRRGVATLHRTHGARTATDAGAAIAHLANELAAALGTRARRAMRRALLATCRGQIRELSLPFVAVSPRTRLAVMQEKTGAFFELAADLGAILAGGNPRSRAAVRRFARRFGVAFQVADDVLDLAGARVDLGRTNGADLREGVLTLPVLLANDPDRRLAPLLERIRCTRDADAVADCATRVIRGGGVAAASAVAEWWLARAVEALAGLAGRNACAHLVELARTSVQRGLRVSTPTFARDSRSSREPPPALSFANRHPRQDPDLAAWTPPRLAHLLDWLHPGLSAMVAARAAERTVDEHRSVLRERLCRGRRWSPDAILAAEAIALAHALADDGSLARDPVLTLALVDALHCAAIGFLAVAPTSREHVRMAARARRLVDDRRPYDRRPELRRPYEQAAIHLTA
ncbi:MAG: polyprenyl synthetase family protein [Deltaproteobacteria bacterium]|nr:polyprenyl synthetase family protein [Deltaproteobacteria bacterium]